MTIRRDAIYRICTQPGERSVRSSRSSHISQWMPSSMKTPKPKRQFRWRTVGCLLLALVMIGGSIAVIIYRTMVVRPPDTTQQLQSIIVPVEQGDLIKTVQVNGTLEPVNQIAVSFPDGVRVVEVLKAEGEQVAANQILARLETRDLELKVTSAKARLEQAQQILTKLQAGPSPANLAQATARIARARADLASDQNAVRAIDIELAKSTLDLAREKLADSADSLPRWPTNGPRGVGTRAEFPGNRCTASQTGELLFQ